MGLTTFCPSSRPPSPTSAACTTSRSAQSQMMAFAVLVSLLAFEALPVLQVIAFHVMRCRLYDPIMKILHTIAPSSIWRRTLSVCEDVAGSLFRVMLHMPQADQVQTMFRTTTGHSLLCDNSTFGCFAWDMSDFICNTDYWHGIVICWSVRCDWYHAPVSWIGPLPLPSIGNMAVEGPSCRDAGQTGRQHLPAPCMKNGRISRCHFCLAVRTCRFQLELGASRSCMEACRAAMT